MPQDSEEEKSIKEMIQQLASSEGAAVLLHGSECPHNEVLMSSAVTLLCTVVGRF